MSAQNLNTPRQPRQALGAARFPLGRTVITPGALETLEESGQEPGEFLSRHVRGDWGDLEDRDKRENEFSVERHLRIFSAYHTSKSVKVWVITEAEAAWGLRQRGRFRSGRTT